MAAESAKSNVTEAGTGRSPSAERTSQGPVFVPATDIFESEDKVYVLAEIPGTEPDGVNVTLDRNILRITASNRMQAPGKYSLIHAEYRTGDYERSFTLSTDIDRDRIEASVKDGLLKLVLPKAKPDVRSISVKTG